MRALTAHDSAFLQAGIFDPNVVTQIEYIAELLRDYFAAVQPTPFLHDTTTKNVIVDNGKLSGIVDVDSLCFGDPLLVPALTNMALLASNQATDYVDYWLSHLALDSMQRRVFAFYTVQYCVDFMGSVGQVFNGNNMDNDKTYCQRLSTLFEELMQLNKDYQ